jgi:hypothetical protein
LYVSMVSRHPYYLHRHCDEGGAWGALPHRGVTAGGRKVGEGKRVDVGGRRGREGVVFRRQVCDDPQQELFARVEPSVLLPLSVDGQR